jgi:DNA mismatch endonuclease, patch repair protein
MDTVSKAVRSKIMSSVKGRDTSLELALRRELWKRGLRYRVEYGKDRIDIAFPKERLAIFVDGCFWHRCPIHGTIPATNADYWVPKLEANVERDRKKTARLAEEGWMVIRVWEHELLDVHEVASKIIFEYSRRRG